MKWGLWSQTAASNSATPPDGWPEGQLPSTVNDCAREMMAAIRTGLTDLQFIDQGDSPTYVSATKFSVPGNLTATYQIGRRLKMFDASTLYGTIIDASGSAASTTVTVRFDSTPLTTSFSSVAVSIMSNQNYATPDIAFKNENVLINPYLDIWGAGNSFSAGGGITVMTTADMWKLTQTVSSTCAINLQRFERSANTSNVPTLAQAGMFLNSSIGISVSAGVATMATTQFSVLGTSIEGFNYRNIAQKPLAFQMWVKSNRTGTYCVAFRTNVGSNTILFDYAISSTSWERKTFMIPPSPSTGTQDYSSGIGLNIALGLASGSTFQGGGGNWTATALITTANQINFLASAGNTIRFTGFQLQEGTQCGPLQFKNVTDEQLKCQRYRPTFGNNSSSLTPFCMGQVVNAGQALISVPFLAPTRVQPTGISFNNNATTSYVLSNPVNALVQVSSIAVNLASLTNAQLLVSTVGAAGLNTAGQGTYFANTNTNASFVLTGAEL